MKLFSIPLLFLLITASLSAQPQWKWFNPSPDGFSLNSVWFVDAGHAWAVGDNGKIIAWNGHNWTRQDSKTQKTLQSVYFTDAYHGWAVGKEGCILRYENGGWTDRSLGYPANLRCVVISGAGDGWIGGDTTLRLTNDQWSLYTSQDTLDFQSMSFTTANDGWAISQGAYLCHFDGNSWMPKTTDYKFCPICPLSFADADHGMVAAYWWYPVLFIYDHGKLINPMPVNGIYSVCMTDSTSGYAVGNGQWGLANGSRYSSIIKFKNGNWSIDTVVETELYTVHGNGDLMWATGAGGTIYLKQAGKWKLVSSYTDHTITSVSFPDSLHGWMASPYGDIFKYDHGILKKDTVFPDLIIYGIHFTDSLTGFGIGVKIPYDSSSKFLEYHNKKWKITDQYKHSPFAFSVLDAEHIWAISNWTILFYNDTSWQEYTIELPIGWKFEGICAVSPTVVYAVGTNSYHTSFLMKYDGSAWTMVKDDLPPYLELVAAVDEQVCWMASFYGEVYKFDIATQELVKEVPQQNSYFSYMSLQMTSNQKGYIANQNGVMEYDGTTWSYIEELPSVTPIAIDFTHENFKWVSGFYGTLLSTYAGSTLSNPDEPYIDAKSRASIYPNPVCENSVLKYEVLTKSEVTVEILDVFGRTISSSREGFQNPGIYTCSLSKAYMFPGMYFCRVTIGSDMQTIRLLKN